MVRGDVGFELLITPAVYDDLRHAVCCMEIFNQLICAESGLAGLAVNQRVGESAHVSGCHPGLRVHQDRRVETDIVLDSCTNFLHQAFLTFFFSSAQRTVIPCIGKTPVNFGARIDKPSVLRKGNDFFHCYFSVYIAHVHSTYLFYFVLLFILPAFRMLRLLQLLPAQQYRFSLRLFLPFRLFSCPRKYSRSHLFL